MSLPRYPKYKNSGVEWLGEVPSHWEVLSIKRLSPVQRGASPRPIDDPKYFDDQGEYAWVRIADVSASNGLLTETTQRLSELGSSLSVKISPGELFVSIAGTVGKPCISGIKACIHDGFVYFPNLKIPPHFLFRIFEAGLCYSGLGKWGTQLNLNTDTIGSIKIALPSADELPSVLDFLDHETAKIDALIAEQEKLLTLLAEKRQATISHAVTRGLNPDLPMKDSGVAWLGPIPTHWEMKRIKDCGCEIVDCKNRTPELHPEGGYFVVRTSCVKNGEFNPEEGFFTDEANYLEWTQKGKPRPGDVLFTREAPTGEACLAPANLDFCLGQRMMYIRPPAEILASKFLLHSIYSGLVRERIDSKSKGSTVGHLRVGEVGELPLLLPPIREQQEIVSFLDTEITKLDTLNAETVHAIELLKERRNALIAAAVTGKIDVREQPSELEAAA